MSVELRPLGVHCNLQCQYCYQQPERDAGNVASKYDIAAMKAAIEEEGRPFTLFGGEPLLLPIDDLEALWSWGLAKFGQNSIQTNGALIGEEHIRLFKAYKVDVGISIDGPGELNDVRWQGTLRRTREATAATERAIARLCEEGRAPGLIVTLHRGNAAGALLPRLQDWMRALDALGVRSARLHLLEVESPIIRRKYALSTEENIEALLSFKALEPELKRLRFDFFREMRALLLGRDHEASCVWKACDPDTTAAVSGVEGFGQRSNCGRTNKDGIDFVKAASAGFERYLALHATPQAFGGCQGCRFFLMCKGQCPGTALDSDWRNRTEHCGILMSLYERIERELVAEGYRPVSLDPQRGGIEEMFLTAWAAGAERQMSDLIPSAKSDAPAWRSELRELRKDFLRPRPNAGSPALS
jgi:uncharacterized protein